MYKNCKLGGLLTFAQLEVLKSLSEMRARRGTTSFWQPRDLGAYRSSHHTHTLTKLASLGYVERSEVAKAGAGRPRYLYKITDAGQVIWEEFQSLARVPASQVLGGQADQGRAAFAQRLLA
jgi:DNA-binding MarR family transcriptional regulator